MFKKKSSICDTAFLFKVYLFFTRLKAAYE